VLILAALLFTVTSAEALTGPYWPAYLNGPAHSSYQPAATALSPTAVPQLKPLWSWHPTETLKPGQPGQLLFASPTVMNGRVFIGSDAGYFYAIDAATGRAAWSRFLGYTVKTTCGGWGVVATATVAPDPVTHVSTVYVDAADGYLYALRAADGALVWKSLVARPSTTVNNYMNWSSPTVMGGHVYVGLASNCDIPLIRGGEVSFGQHTGAKEATHYTIAAGSVGNSVWSSAAGRADGSIFITTGNGPTSGTESEAVVRLQLAGGSLVAHDSWQVPPQERTPDSDFGGSATFFSASIGGTRTPMVGACNKNGIYYALRQSALRAGPVWELHVSKPYGSDAEPGQCDAAAVWDGAHLYIGGNGTTIQGKPYSGSIRKIDPGTGLPLWETGLAGQIIGSPTMNGAGVVAAVTYNTHGGSNNLYLINAGTGAILRAVTLNSPAFGQPVFAGDRLYVAAQKGLTVWGLP